MGCKEYLVAQKVHIVIGTEAWPSSVFEKVVIRISDLYYRNTRIYNNDPAEQVQTNRSLIMTSWASFARTSLWRKMYHQARDMLTMSRLLGVSLELEATDSKDRIYALYGIVDHSIRQSIRVDYSKSVEELALQVSTHLARTGNAEFLLSSRRYQGR